MRPQNETTYELYLDIADASALPSQAAEYKLKTELECEDGPTGFAVYRLEGTRPNLLAWLEKFYGEHGFEGEMFFDEYAEEVISNGNEK